jgi:TolB-like protein
VSSDQKTVTKKKLNHLIIIALSLAVIFLIINQVYFSNNSNSNIVSENENNNSLINSIAVLPFKNISGSSDNEAFCDGMTTAIISRLSKIKDIKRVISQTTVMGYKQTVKTMPQIAKELDVSYILESAFQKSGDDIKINLQLIDGTSDKLVWSQEYDGKYESIFNIQAEVAEIVAKQLNAEISDSEKIEIKQKMTNNLEAYENFLRGQLLETTYSLNNIIASRKYYEKAIELDSMFVEAYVRIGATYAWQGVWFGNLNKSVADSLAAPYYQKALKIDPNNRTVLRNISNENFFNWNFKVVDSINNVFKRNEPNFQNYFFDITQGRFKQVINTYNKVRKSYNSARDEDFWVVYAYIIEGQFDFALGLMDELLQISPNREQFLDHFGNVYLALGKYDMAKDLLETGLEISDKRHPSMIVHLALVEHFLVNEDNSKKLLNEVIERANAGEPNMNVFVAHYYARLGKNDEAFKWLNKAYKEHEVDLIWLKADPNLRQLMGDIRYQELIKKIGFLDD